MPKVSGIKPPDSSNDIPFAELLKYALKVGLGRNASAVPNRIEWQYADLVNETGISERSIRSYRNGNQPPSTTHLKRLFSVLLQGEYYKAEWEIAFIQAWARVALDIKISPRSAPTLSGHVGHIVEISEVSASDIALRKQNVGAAASWSNINLGTYASRPHLFDEVCSQFEMWITQASASLDNGCCPVFWIDGRSGDGKSVLLLQLARQAVENQYFVSSVFANSADDLPEVVNFLIPQADGEELALAIVDDIHKISDLDKFKKSMQSLLNTYPFRVAILTCGPTPEKDEFQSRNKIFEITSWTIPELAEIDLEVFGNWFGTSFGNISISNRMILVELLFELSVGEPIENFADSFRRRLMVFDVFEATRTMLAVNSLDMSAPDCVFQSNHQRLSINRLAANDQLHFERIPEPWGEGIRLVHNQIARRILRFWLKDSLRMTPQYESFSNEISQVLSLDCIDGQFAYYLTRTICEKLDSIIEHDTDADTSRLVSFFDCLAANSSSSPKAHGYALGASLALWISGELASCNDHTVKLARAALSKNGISNKTKAGIFSNLAILEQKGLINGTEYSDNIEKYLFGDGAEEIGNTLVHLARFKIVSQDTIGRWLASFPSAEIPPEVFSFAGSNKIVVNAAISWVEENPTSLQAGKTLASLLKNNPSSDQVKDCSLDWLANGMTSSGSSNVAAMLLNLYTSDKIAKTIAYRWVSLNANRQDLHQILAILLKNYPNQEDTKMMSIEWLEKQRGTPSASNILAVVVRKYPRDVKVLELAKNWTNQHISVPGMDGVATGLLSVLHGQSKFFEQSNLRLRRGICVSLMRWYYSDYNLDSKPNFASAVLKKFPNLRGIRERAMRELSRMRNSPGIHSFLGAMLHAFKRDESIRQTVVDWIKTNNDHGGIPNVLCALIVYDYKLGDNQIIALDWCEKNLDHSGLQQVLASLLAAIPENDRVKFILHRLFDNNLLRDVEPTLISPVLKAYPDDSEIIRKIHAWCQRNAETRGVHMAFSTIVKYLENQEEVLSFVVNWAENNFNSPGVEIVFLSLIRNKYSRFTVRNISISWIDINLESKGWASLAAALLEYYQDDDEIVQRCFSWLESCSDKQKSKALQVKIKELNIGK